MVSLLPVLSAAYFLDLLIGDPQVWFHPIRFLGKTIEWGERCFRFLIKSELFGGLLFAIVIPSAVFFSSYFVIHKLSSISAVLSAAFEIVLVYASLSTKDLAVESRWVRNALLKGELKVAKEKLSWIVGRETKNLNEKGMIRAVVETIAESTVDGIIAPLFYAFLGGAPLAMTYKAINPLDSRICHRNERYIQFGKSAAAIDRWVNWIPARLAGIFIPLAALLSGNSFKKSLKFAWRDGLKSKVPNAGIPEGALAGALGVQLGGVNFYDGVAIETDLLGDPIHPLSLDKIDRSIQILYVTSMLFFSVGIGIRLILI